MFKSINPTNGEIISTYSQHDRDEVKTIIDQTHKAWLKWKEIPFTERAALMQKAADVLLAEKEKYGRLMVLEMGKTMKQAVAEVEKCAACCNFYAEHAKAFLSNEEIETDAHASYIAYNPLGVVLAVMPWNFPFWQVFRFAAPALMGGNAALLKHASNVMGCAMAIEEVFLKAGFPENLFRTLRIPGSEVTGVIENPLVKAVTLTGSVGAGSAVAKKAGEMIKKTVLELGGSDPYLVLEDADIEYAVETCVTSRLINGGQSCIAAKRFIIVQDVYERFEKLFVEKMKTKKMGDPFADDTVLGPQARENLRDELHDQVLKSIEKGARCLLGGYIPDQKGAWYPPTVLVDVQPGMPAYEEEMFGPVAALIRAKDEANAIRIANDSVFGLGAAVFTRNKTRGQKIAEEKLNAGCCFVNDFVKSDPRLPFGGINESGYGRELSYLGIREFLNVKTVWVR
ncbi:MAG: NAD-dependent succinate-semialdehyde dehydrogenase [Bacteroidetes bacterium]|nr:MAG: NAD-dependent succinate-semialdehyde dehydrogenase [Bacteroidota bacterium]